MRLGLLDPSLVQCVHLLIWVLEGPGERGHHVSQHAPELGVGKIHSHTDAGVATESKEVLVDLVLGRGEGLVVAVALQPPVNIEFLRVLPGVRLLVERQSIHNIARHPRVHPRLPPVRGQPRHIKSLGLVHPLHHWDGGEQPEGLADNGFQHGEVRLAQVRGGQGAILGLPLELRPVLAVELVTEALLGLRVLRQEVGHPADTAVRRIKRSVEEPLHRRHPQGVREERRPVRFCIGQ
mmetsp:Transcript_42089/g.91709  ORF Transcript_42089/g.91709 Transcript_42089/m.91709 type:complete len:237 (-) Transcript_42089:506-1216(-)